MSCAVVVVVAIRAEVPQRYVGRVPLIRRIPGGRHRGIFFGLHHLLHPGVLLIVLVVAVLVVVLLLRRRR